MIDVSVITTGIVGLVTTIVGSWSGWFFARRKYNSEVDHNVIDNLQSSLDFYKRLVDDNTKRLDEVLERNKELETSVRELLKKNDSLEQEISVLRKQMFDMMANICMDLSCAMRVRDLQAKKKVKKTKEETESKENTKQSETTKQ